MNWQHKNYLNAVWYTINVIVGLFGRIDGHPCILQSTIQRESIGNECTYFIVILIIRHSLTASRAYGICKDFHLHLLASTFSSVSTISPPQRLVHTLARLSKKKKKRPLGGPAYRMKGHQLPTDLSTARVCISPRLVNPSLSQWIILNEHTILSSLMLKLNGVVAFLCLRDLVQLPIGRRTYS